MKLLDESEAQFQSWVVDLAKLTGWLVYHTRPSMNTRGRWATHITGDAGFPDLMLAHPRHGALFVELKTRLGKTTVAQDKWLDTLTTTGHYAQVWRPEHRGEITLLLQRGRP